MATVYGAWTGPGASFRSVLVYTLTETDTSVTISTTLRIQTKDYTIVDTPISGTTTIGTGSGASSSATIRNAAANTTTTILTKTRTYAKTTANQTIALNGVVTLMGATSTASVNVTVMRFSYPVTYDANGGDASSVPAAQTKWWGTNLTLSSTVPTRPGCTFLGWATAADGTGTAYAAGQVYTGNHALTLYAMWLGVSVPTIETQRTDSEGAEADEGTYGTLAASWQVIGSPAADVAVVATNVNTGATIALSGDATGSKAAQQALTGNVSALFGADEGQSGALDTDTRYTIRVTVTATALNAYSGSTVSATATSYITYAYITMDFRVGGRGVSFGKTAVRDGFDMAMEPFYAKVPAQHDTDLLSHTIASIIAANDSDVTITSATVKTWGKVAQLYINWTNKAAITVPASGNISNVTIGTVAEGLRPAILTAAHSYGDSAGAAWYYVSPNGTVQLGAMEGTGTERTIAANTTFNLLCTYILP